MSNISMQPVTPPRQGFAAKFDRFVTAVSPRWAHQREQHRLAAAQARFMTAGYESTMQSLQRRPHPVIPFSQDGLLLEPQLRSVWEWSRETYRNNSLYSSIIRRAVDNIVGTGLTVQAATGDDGYNTELEQGFAEYCQPKGGWDLIQRHDFHTFQRLLLTSVIRDGDILGYRSDDGWQWFESVQMGTPAGYKNAKGGDNLRIIRGVEMDDNDRATYYWVSKFSKQGWGYLDMATAKGLRADKCLHIGNYEFLNMTRPLPVYHNALAQFEDFYRYLEAELLGAMAAACQVFELNSPFQNALNALGLQNKDTKGAIDARNKQLQIKPGNVVQTFQGEKLSIHANPRPNSNLPEYVRQNMRLFGIPVGLPLEVALMDFSQTNFAGAKMAITQAALTFLTYQDCTLGKQCVSPVWRDWVTNVAPSRGIRAPQSKAGTKITPLRHEILPPKSQWIDAYKEVSAINAQIDYGWESVAHAVKENMNRELSDVLRDNAEALLLVDQIATEKKVDPAKLSQTIRLGAKTAATTPPASDEQEKETRAALVNEAVRIVMERIK